MIFCAVFKRYKFGGNWNLKFKAGAKFPLSIVQIVLSVDRILFFFVAPDKLCSEIGFGTKQNPPPDQQCLFVPLPRYQRVRFVVRRGGTHESFRRGSRWVRYRRNLLRSDFDGGSIFRVVAPVKWNTESSSFRVFSLFTSAPIKRDGVG